MVTVQQRPNLRQQATGLVRLLRPVNFAMFMVGVGVGGVLVAGGDAFVAENGRRLALAAISAALIGGAANAINDVYDLDIDRINRPRRPLPAGLMTPRAAIGVWVVGSVVGVVVSMALSLAHVGMAVGAAGLLWAYSAWFKRKPLAGNLVVAFVLALALVYGGAAVGSPVAALLGGGFAALTTLAREIVKDIEDVRGDREAQARTLPLVAGTDVAVRWAVVVIFLTVALTPIPFLVLEYGALYLLFAGLANGLLLAAAWPLLSTDAPERQAGRASALLKAAMLAGLAALALA